jgi:hypothetical protein
MKCRCSRSLWVSLAGLVVVTFAVVAFVRYRQSLALESNPMPTEKEPQLPAGDTARGEGELRLPARRPQGGWADPKSGAEFEESRRQDGIELSRRMEAGPIRCIFRARPGAAARNEPELEVELKNVSADPVTLTVHRSLIDRVTFVFRDPDGGVVGTFCSAHLHSPYSPNERFPTVTLKPGESKTASLYLSVAAFRGYQDLQPGLYSVEAVFEARAGCGHFPDMPMLARSNRLQVRVGDF